MANNQSNTEKICKGNKFRDEDREVATKAAGKAAVRQKPTHKTHDFAAQF